MAYFRTAKVIPYMVPKLPSKSSYKKDVDATSFVHRFRDLGPHRWQAKLQELMASGERYS